MKKLASLDSVMRLLAPKAVTFGFNIIRNGSRIALRSIVQLMRATLITRILSCFTILLFDIVDFSRHRISKLQFIRNIVLSGLLILFGTLGWNIGARWFAIEIIGGLIGAGVLSMASGALFDKIVGKYVKSDSECMLTIVSDVLNGYPELNKAEMLKKITPTQLKLMYAAGNREDFAVKLIEKQMVRPK